MSLMIMQPRHRPKRRAAVLRQATLMCSLLGLIAAPASAGTPEPPLSIRNSFRIGTSGVTCTAQNTPLDDRLGGLFDRGYRLSCRDAAGAVGTILAVRRDVALVSERSGLAGVTLHCGAIGAVVIARAGQVEAVNCRDHKAGVEYKRYALKRGKTTYLVEGLAGYDPALRLALASLVSDVVVPGEVRVATTEVSDPAAFARVQAGQMDRLGARDEGYLRNNGGRFAESSEFFEELASRDRSSGSAGLAEALANQGLQQSNLGNFTAADRLFAEAGTAVSRGDGVTQRLIRNYKAINYLNQNRPAALLKNISEIVTDPRDLNDVDNLSSGIISASISEKLNRENIALRQLRAVDVGITGAERAEILDAQADALRGIAYRLQGKFDSAVVGFQKAVRRLDALRGGRFTSLGWLRSDIQIELALVAESQGRGSDAGAAFDRAIAIVGAAFPQSPVLLSVQARKAAWLVRSGNETAAMSLYAKVVEDSQSVPDAGTNLRDLLGPYFSVLAKQGDTTASNAIFDASQILQRPGVAQTQAVLARQLSEGNDEAASLFRLSLTRSRDVARAEVVAARLSALTTPTAQESAELAATLDTLAALRREQTEIIAKLSAFPRYTALAPQRVSLQELKAALRSGEAYYKLIAVGEALYGLWVTSGSSRVVPIALSRKDLSREVQTIRDSIVTIEKGKVVNRPFDLDASRALYKALFGAVHEDLTTISHLVFEPDEAMLQLPPSVLVTDDAGIAAYKARTIDIDADAFDVTGIAWLGRGRGISVAVSPRAFLDIRKLAPSQARRPYLGLGSNSVPAPSPVAAVASECDWPMSVWQRPIKPDELLFAAKTIGGASIVRTGTSFTDAGLLADKELEQYRVLHFATHGLVSAPRKDCPARPALVTSFAAKDSDGLLSFKEIFDLRLDADLVILSACDTAGLATVAASREAGVTNGGNYALDGLVRAFTGAGARAVIASHWPVPDDFDATRRLISGMIEGKLGQSLGQALSEAEGRLMDDFRTSHPFYWAAFVVVGDAAKPVIGHLGQEAMQVQSISTGSASQLH